MDCKIKNRHRLKDKDIKKLQEEFFIVFNQTLFSEKNSVEIGDYEGTNFVFIDRVPCFMYLQDKLIFTLAGINELKPKNNFVVVDMGAVKFVTNGADIMAAGIVDADVNISVNDPVWICDEKFKKPLAVGYALINGEQMKNEKKGKAVANIHYVGDKIWIFVSKSL